MHFENWLNVQMHRAKVKNEHCKGGIFGLAQQSIVVYSFILGREGNYIYIKQFCICLLQKESERREEEDGKSE